MLTLKRRLWLTADRSEAVEDGDERATHLLGPEGGEIDEAEAERLGLDETAVGAAEPQMTEPTGAKAESAPEATKAVKAPAATKASPARKAPATKK
jgi:hypothetical protein